MVGGPHATILPDTIPEYVDYVVRGEGEKAILDIVEGQAHGRIITRTFIDNLDSLPRPAYHHFFQKSYDLKVSAFPDVPVFAMNTSRGCPFHCKFCSVKSIWGNTYRAFSAERVVDDIERLIKDYGIAGIYFREENFTHSSERTQEFCKLLLQKGIRIKWLCESRVHPFDRGLLPLMKKAGCEWMYFGCESGSDRILKQLNDLKERARRMVIEYYNWNRVTQETSYHIGLLSRK